MNKKQVRNEVRGKLAVLTEREFDKQCLLIRQRLFETKEWLQARSIAITISKELEVDTLPIIEQAWVEGKKVAVPKCHPIDRSMSFHYFTHYNQLETVYNNLQEPIEEETEVAFKNEFDIIIVPGVAYDRRGYRIGFGGGYYDRYLQHFDGVTVSLLLDEQLYEKIPNEPFDQPVQNLILPSGVIAIYD